MTAAELADTLLAVLDDVRGALAASEHDGAFGQTPAEVAAEVERAADALRAGYQPDVVQWLFAPTGDLQEVEIANGWVEAFLALARRAEAAQAARVAQDCPATFRRESLSARIAPVALAAAAAVLMAVGWHSGRLAWTLLAGVDAVIVFLPAWFLWMIGGGILSATPLWPRFWEDLRRGTVGTWMFALLILGLLAAVTWVAVGAEM